MKDDERKTFEQDLVNRFPWLRKERDGQFIGTLEAKIIDSSDVKSDVKKTRYIFIPRMCNFISGAAYGYAYSQLDNNDGAAVTLYSIIRIGFGMVKEDSTDPYGDPSKAIALGCADVASLSAGMFAGSALRQYLF